MKATSLKMVAEAGIKSPTQYRDAIIHEWFVPDEYKEKLVAYFLVRVSTKELFDRIQNGEVYIGEKRYSAVWINLPETVKENEWALVSFRFCKYLETGYALIKILKGEPTLFPELDNSYKG